MTQNTFLSHYINSGQKVLSPLVIAKNFLDRYDFVIELFY